MQQPSETLSSEERDTNLIKPIEATPVVVDDGEVVSAVPISRRRRCIVLIAGAVLIVAAMAFGVCGATGQCKPRSQSTTTTATDEPVPHSWAYCASNRTHLLLGPNKNEVKDERAILIVDYLKRVSISTISYPDIVAPADNATAWLIEDDPLQLTADSPSGCFRLQQRYALLTLWFQSAHNQVALSQWMEEEDECRWYGMSCGNKEIGVNGDTQDAIKIVALGNTLNLTGQVPPDLVLLSTFLIQLELDNNYALTGTIPSAFGNFSLITKLDLDNNLLVGTIPDTFLDLELLENFQVHGNMLTGTMPFCGSNFLGGPEIQADCEEVNCPCCSACCPGNDDCCPGPDCGRR